MGVRRGVGSLLGDRHLRRFAPRATAFENVAGAGPAEKHDPGLGELAIRRFWLAWELDSLAI